VENANRWLCCQNTARKEHIAGYVPRTDERNANLLNARLGHPMVFQVMQVQHDAKHMQIVA